MATALLLAPSTWAQNNDLCENASPVESGARIEGNLATATSDGASSCDGGPGTRDRWYSWVAPRSERSFVLGGDRDDIELSIHAGCPGTVQNELACGSRFLGVSGFYGVGFEPTAGETYYLRVAAKEPDAPTLDPYFLSFAPGGVITGVVTDADGQPLPDIPVALGDVSFLRTQTDSEGRYRFGGLEYGSSYVFAGFDSPYVAEIFRDVQCPQLQCLVSGDLVTTGIGAVVTANFSLDPGSTVTGILTDEVSGAPLKGKLMRLFQLVDGLIQLELDVITDAEGRYRFEGLGAGDYTVFAIASGYSFEFWDNVSCLPSTCDISLATLFPVGVGETVGDIDLALDPGLSIRGQVREAGTGTPLAFDVVELRNPAGESLALTIADGDGNYAFTQLVAGSYLVSTASSQYLNAVWPDVPCTFGTDCPTAGATPIQLEVDQSVDGIDFDLDVGGVIRATLRNRFSDGPVSDAGVRLFDPAGNFLSLTLSPADGVAEITGLPTGEYRAVGFTPAGAFVAQVYAASDCPSPVPDDCQGVAAGTPIEVIRAEQTDIEFDLRPNGGLCSSDAQTLCLNDNRFAVRASWQTPAGDQGLGNATPLPGIDDSGTFWFFDSENTELVVKVLDACGVPFDRFWVFASGLTNVEVELTVVDTLLGDEKVYVNPLGAAFQPIQDTDAFDTCLDAGVGPPVVTAPSEPGPGVSIPDAAAVMEAMEAQLKIDHLRRAAKAASSDAADNPAVEKADCVPSSTSLCLGAGGRFRVDASWQTPDGDAGPATAVSFREDTGLFWFFDSGNVEVIVKVLDACAPPFDHFWVFAGGLTNVDVRLQVTDTVTGQARVYRNAQGQRFLPIQDTSAFATCP